MVGKLGLLFLLTIYLPEESYGSFILQFSYLSLLSYACGMDLYSYTQTKVAQRGVNFLKSEYGALATGVLVVTLAFATSALFYPDQGAGVALALCLMSELLILESTRLLYPADRPIEGSLGIALKAVLPLGVLSICYFTGYPPSVRLVFYALAGSNLFAFFVVLFRNWGIYSSIRFAWQPSVLKKALRFASYLFFSTVLLRYIFYFDKEYVSSNLSLVDNAVYGYYLNFAVAIATLTDASYTQINFKSLYSDAERSFGWKLIRKHRLFIIHLIVAAGFSAALAMLGAHFGNKATYQDKLPLLLILVGGGVFYALIAFLKHILVAQGRTKTVLVGVALSALLFFGALQVVHPVSTEGVAWCWLLGMQVCVLFFSWKIVSVNEA